ncbi:MAG: hypothetical protein R3A51_04740 [Nannocystaceae bacterium]|nr:hypothetical protein [Myxococcales bacterium]
MPVAARLRGRALAVALTCLFGHVGGAGASPPPETTARRTIALVVEGADAASLRAAVSLRLPEFTLVDAPGPDAYVVRISVEGDAARVEVGRGGDRWTRTIDEVTGDLSQELATAAANLVMTLEYERPRAPPPDPRPAPVESTPPASPRPAATPPASASPARPLGPVEEDSDQPPWSAAIGLAPVVTLELGTPDGVLSGLGAQLTVDALHRGGGFVHFGARASGRGYADFLGLVRLRLAAGGGYVRSLGDWRLGFLAALAVEPWWPLRGSSRVDVRRDQSEVRPAPLLGGHAQLVAWRLLGRGSRLRARLGPVLEVSGMVSPDGGVPELLVESARGGVTSLGHFGGLEVTLGVEIGIALARER